MSQEKIEGLQTLRGICILMIFVHHFRVANDVIDAFGDCGVSVFLMLSGFVLGMAFNALPREGYGVHRWKTFMWKRLVRIYPLYLLGLVAAVAANGGAGLKPVLASIFMLQSWIPSEEYNFALNGPGWFISTLFFCYALFLPAMWLMKYRRGLFVLGCAIYLCGYILTLCLVEPPYVTPAVYVFPPMQFPTFLLGMMAGVWFAGCRYRIHFNPGLKSGLTCGLKTGFTQGAEKGLLLMAGIVAVVVALACWGRVSPKLTLCSYWWLPSALVITGTATADIGKGWLKKALNWRPAVEMGNISYSFFILHAPWIVCFDKVVGWLGWNIPYPADCIIACALMIGIACMVHYKIEMPMMKFLHAHIKVVD